LLTFQIKLNFTAPAETVPDYKATLTCKLNFFFIWCDSGPWPPHSRCF